MTSAVIPDPMPEEGYRKLSPQEMMRRQRALTCIRSRETAQCQGQVYVTLFFDGTGNNKDDKEGGSKTQKERWKHSNVARLFDAAMADNPNGFFPYYIAGVGTPFPDVDDTDGGKTLGAPLGLGSGHMGADRINWAITRVYNAVHHYLTGSDLFRGTSAKTIVRNMSSSVGALSFEAAYRKMVLQTWEKKLAAVAQSSQRKVTQINLAVFGFSRGSAEARAFANWFTDIVKQNDGGFELAGISVRFYFLGIFDTVASVGAPNLVSGWDGHMAWADGVMAIPATVEQCIHYVALHEQRACFPAEAASNVKQIVYPGMHSDVGGGYLPTEQGKLAQCSQIPLNDMHFEAIRAGVPLMSIDEINSHGDLKTAFHIPKELTAAYNQFWTACGLASGGRLRDIVRQHTHQYVQWRGGMLVAGKGLSTRRFFRDSSDVDRGQLRKAEDDLEGQVKRLRLQIDAENIPQSQIDNTGLVGLYGDTPKVKPVDTVTRSLLAELDKHATLPQAVSDFFDDYVHDSRAGFTSIPISKLEPSDITGGYLRYRNIYQNERRAANVASIPQQSSSVADLDADNQTMVA
ncbi:hypothetical protein F4827_004265 [Paraburkholderia bannensis]|uniref:T6SS Phospholipase effector Tle1-like catalytic domain-containing protein n=1 Tax=Paraburkholderia bannensis TaxID=765414 RepID=A0A7W9U175_9BURK|nr:MULTISPECIES: DUF2235 domain-containing protein [Paraburkholderia]MBB3259390.1 hypothetical protein [Paraburkholderia sp. WP4_3_2]MBB6104406.1 hypothetical protein [Paraburkholderia bannensis]